MKARRFQIIAQDPSIRGPDGRVLTATVNLPSEDLLAGPMGAAIYVVDYDGSARAMYTEAPVPGNSVRLPNDDALLTDPQYHAHNVYAIVMRTLARFEQALGRRVAWGIRGHQLKIVPHAFNDANSYYSPELESLLFGYIRGEPTTYLCLSHDVVVHETTHALLDGLRDKFNAPSSPDQAALHEAFADMVALLSVFSLVEITRYLLSLAIAGPAGQETPAGFVKASALSVDVLKDTALFGLAEEMRGAASDTRINALRRSVRITPDPDILKRDEYADEHRRGEVLVAAVMQGFLAAWTARLGLLAASADDLVNVDIAAEQGQDIADVLLTMVIRAIDYTPPIHIGFGDFLRALLTADEEVRLDDSRFQLRMHLKEAMAAFGIEPASPAHDGRWIPHSHRLVRSGSHFDALQSDPTEMFRLIWRNREKLTLNPEAHTRIASVRPCMRVSPEDGFQLRETVVECTQYLKLNASELNSYGLRMPTAMPDATDVVLEGGSTLILDEYGDLKFEVSNHLPSLGDVDHENVVRWQARLEYLWDHGYITEDEPRSLSLSAFHRELDLTAEADGSVEALRQKRLCAERW
jgi:hypothetical protein